MAGLLVNLTSDWLLVGLLQRASSNSASANTSQMEQDCCAVVGAKLANQENNFAPDVWQIEQQQQQLQSSSSSKDVACQQVAIDETNNDEQTDRREGLKTITESQFKSDSSQPETQQVEQNSQQLQDFINVKLETENNSTNNNNNNNNGNINNNSCSSNSSLELERRYRPQKYCAVCGDKAIACNFNAVTCESCKAFFRRNAFKEQRLKCLFDNRCIIDRLTRRFCSKCRLLKCFQIGMKREWILTDEQKQIKRVKIMQNKQTRQLASCSSSQSDDSSHQLAACTTKIGTSNQLLTDADDKNNKLLELNPTSTARRSFNGRRRIETKDAATSCSDDFASQVGRQLDYCSLAFQCQYCSIRLASSCMQPQTGQLEYSHEQYSSSSLQVRGYQSSSNLALVGGFSLADQLMDQQTTTLMPPADVQHLSSVPSSSSCSCHNMAMNQPNTSQLGQTQNT